MRRSPFARDRLALYEAAVQGVEYDLDFFERVWRSIRGGRFRSLREDFCGTAQLACAWAQRRPENRAWGLDLDPEVMVWARAQRLARLGGVARRSLRADGVFFLSMFGGMVAMDRLVEKHRVAPCTGPDGLRLPGFTYVWEQAGFNPVDHRLVCNIHFQFGHGRELRRAFHYDWRMWMLPEVREVLDEAGFRTSEVYVEGWDARHHRPDEVLRKRRRFENQPGWLGFVVGVA